MENNMAKKYGRLNLAVAVFATLYIIIMLLHGMLGRNDICFSWLGCNAGFFGYDAIFEHFLCAFVGTLVIARYIEKHPHRSIFSNTFVKNFIVIVSLVTFGGVLWEVFEFSYDQLFVHDLIQENRIFIDHRLQPGLVDTMGDLTFDMMGAIFGVVLLRFISAELVKKS